MFLLTRHLFADAALPGCACRVVLPYPLHRLTKKFATAGRLNSMPVPTNGGVSVDRWAFRVNRRRREAVWRIGDIERTALINRRQCVYRAGVAASANAHASIFALIGARAEKLAGGGSASWQKRRCIMRAVSGAHQRHGARHARCASAAPQAAAGFIAAGAALRRRDGAARGNTAAARRKRRLRRRGSA
jgi:hypothetical protein